MTRAPVRPEPKTRNRVPRAAAEQQDVQALLARAVEEAARLLNADGAMVYLVDPDEDRLRFAVDAGIQNPEARQLIRDVSLPVGVGLFGHAIASGEVVVSGDYRRDKRFPHSDVTDRIAVIANMRSMAAAPLTADGQVLGALGAYSSRIDDFDEAEVALLRALADHAAGAIANQRLIEQLASSREELARRVDAQRTLGQISARIAVIREPGEILHSVVEAARRLIGSDGAHLTLMQPGGENLRPSVAVGGNAAWTEEWLATQDFPINGGINGLAAGSGAVIATEDYLVDPRIPHEPDDQEVAERMGLRGMAAAPLALAGRRGDRDPGGLVRDGPRLQRGRARAAPGPGRPGCDRHLELALDEGSARADRRARAPRRCAADARRHGRPAHLPARPGRGAAPDAARGRAAAQGPRWPDRHGGHGRRRRRAVGRRPFADPGQHDAVHAGGPDAGGARGFGPCHPGRTRQLDRRLPGRRVLRARRRRPTRSCESSASGA